MMLLKRLGTDLCFAALIVLTVWGQYFWAENLLLFLSWLFVALYCLIAAAVMFGTEALGKKDPRVIAAAGRMPPYQAEDFVVACVLAAMGHFVLGGALLFAILWRAAALSGLREQAKPTGGLAP